MFDITKLAVADTSVLHLKGPDDELLFSDAAKKEPITVTLFGPGSPEFAAVDKRLNDRNIARMMKGRNKASITAETSRADQIEKLVACTQAFSPNFTYPPAADATGADLFQAVYSDRKIGFISDQVQAHIGDWANFTASSATS